jgi:hypothetical protein
VALRVARQLLGQRDKVLASEWCCKGFDFIGAEHDGASASFFSTSTVVAAKERVQPVERKARKGRKEQSPGILCVLCELRSNVPFLRVLKPSRYERKRIRYPLPMSTAAAAAGGDASVVP